MDLGVGAFLLAVAQNVAATGAIHAYSGAGRVWSAEPLDRLAEEAVAAALRSQGLDHRGHFSVVWSALVGQVTDTQAQRLLTGSDLGTPDDRLLWLARRALLPLTEQDGTGGAQSDSLDVDTDRLAREFVENYKRLLAEADSDTPAGLLANFRHAELRALLVEAGRSLTLLRNAAMSQTMNALQAARPDHFRVLLNIVLKDLLAERNARVDEAGHQVGAAIALTDVYVDLPLDGGGINPFDSPAGAVAYLLRKAKVKLGSAIGQEDDPSRIVDMDVAAATHNRPKHIVLLGGPGQGKSTVTQAFCQLLRRAVLESMSRGAFLQQHPVDKEASIAWILDQYQGLIEREQLPPVPPRLPFTIQLTQLAEYIGSGADVQSAVLDFMAQRVSRRLSVTVRSEDVMAWFQALPVVLVFDGLDEVSASSERTTVVEAIRHFGTAVTSWDMDALIVVTTRPQGYSNDFDSERYEHTTIADLSPQLALRYGQRLAEARYGVGEPKGDRVAAELARATEAPATARLLSTPLNVSIMTAHIAGGGRPPQELWSLYSEYYRMVYAREVERGTYASDLLERLRPDIHVIHAKVALLLQRKGESSSRRDAAISAREFYEIVSSYLIAEEKAELGLAERIVTAATDRLVFLVGAGHTGSDLGFQHRTFQEFFAAEALLSVEEVALGETLSSLAWRPYWRNVLLFCVGKCFLTPDRPHLRDTVLSVIAFLENDPAIHGSRLIGRGAEVSLDVVRTGMVIRQPKYLRRLTRSACSLLDSPRGPEPRRLADVDGVEGREEVLKAIEDRLEPALTPRSQGAWWALLSLCDAGSDVAVDLLGRYWPERWSDQRDILVTRDEDHVNGRLEINFFGGRQAAILLLRVMRQVPVMQLAPILDAARFDVYMVLRASEHGLSSQDVQLAEDLLDYIDERQEADLKIDVHTATGQPVMTAHIRSTVLSEDQLSTAVRLRAAVLDIPAWQLLALELNLLIEPNTDVLVLYLSEVVTLLESGAVSSYEAALWHRDGPWPVRAAFYSSPALPFATALREAIASLRARSGEGAFALSEIEDAWAGAVLGNVAKGTDLQVGEFFDARHAVESFPLVAARFYGIDVPALRALWAELPDGWLRRGLAHILVDLIEDRAVGPADSASRVGFSDWVGVWEDAADWTAIGRQRGGLSRRVLAIAFDRVQWDGVDPHGELLQRAAAAAQRLSYRGSPEHIHPQTAEYLLALLGSGEAQGLLAPCAYMLDFPFEKLSAECIVRADDVPDLNVPIARIRLLRADEPRVQLQRDAATTAASLTLGSEVDFLMDQFRSRVPSWQLVSSLAELAVALPHRFGGAAIAEMDAVTARLVPPL